MTVVDLGLLLELSEVDCKVQACSALHEGILPAGSKQKYIPELFFHFIF